MRVRLVFVQSMAAEIIPSNLKLRQLQILSMQNSIMLVTDYRKMPDESKRRVQLELSRIIRQLLI